MLRRYQWWIILAAVGLSAGLMSLPSRLQTRLKLGIGSIFLPLFGLAKAGDSLSNSAGSIFVPRAELLREIKVLREDKRRLNLQLLNARQVWRENSRLRELVDWRREAPWNMKLARVIAKDPANWWRSIQIDLGSDDGVRKHTPVVSERGLVGKVTSVGAHRSQIALVGDASCQVGCQMADSGDAGIIVAGRGSVLDPRIVIMNLPRKIELQPGDTVLTRGVGGVFPPGIPIGNVIDSRTRDFGIFTEARVRLGAKLESLDYVWVILPEEE